MPDLWSAATEEAYASTPVDEFPIDTLELLHPVFVDDGDPPAADSIRVALDERDWDLQYEAGAPLFSGETKTFTALAMEFSLPEQGEGNFGSLDMSLDNVPRWVWSKLQAAARIRASARLIYRQWIALRDLETGEYSVSGPPDVIIDQLTMKIVSATRLRIEGSASFIDMLNKAFPRKTFNRTDWPGLFGGVT